MREACLALPLLFVTGIDDRGLDLGIADSPSLSEQDSKTSSVRVTISLAICKNVMREGTYSGIQVDQLW